MTELKQYFSSPPILSSPLSEEELVMYLVVSEVAVSAVLFHEENKKQRHVFYVSRMLLAIETRYSAVEKMMLALVNEKKKLRHYFETHLIIVITDFPIKQILSKPDLSGRLKKWAIELGVYGISYLPRTAKKGQAIADLWLKCSHSLQNQSSFCNQNKSSKRGYLVQVELRILLV